GRDDEVRGERAAAADRVDDDLALLAGGGTVDGLRHLELAGPQAVGVGDVRFGDAAGGDRHRLAGPVDNDRHRAGGPGGGVGDRAARRRVDLVVLPGLVTRGSAGGDHEVRRQGPAVAHRVDGDLALLTGGGAGDRLAHEQ